jgi:rubrerythrin
LVLVTTIRQMLSIADAMERGAAQRYETLAECMRRVGHADLARIFDALAIEERHHVESVERLQEAAHTTGSSADFAGFGLPETFEIEDAASAALLTPYKALSIAVRCEEEAFTFWTYVASETTDADVRVEAEMMARQELVHAAKLRHERRRAYQTERLKRQVEPVDTLDSDTMRIFIGRQEGETAEILKGAAGWLEGSMDPALLKQMRAFADSLADGAHRETMPSPAGVGLERAASVGPVGILFEAAGSVEKLIEQYLVLIGRNSYANGESSLERRCEAATATVAAMNACLYALEPSLQQLGRGASGKTVGD